MQCLTIVSSRTLLEFSLLTAYT